MARTAGRSLAVVVLLVGLVAVTAGGAVAQDGQADGAEDGDELLAFSGWEAVGALLFGTGLLFLSVEVLIRAIVHTALRYRVSAFLLAVVFSGIEFDNVAFGLFTGFREMQNVAFGLAIGNAVSIFGLTLGIGALLYPFDVDVPRDYLALLVASPFVLIPFLLLGRFDPIHGLFLVSAYLLIFAYVLRRERSLDREFMRSDEVREVVAVGDGDATETVPFARALGGTARRNWFWPALMVVALAGIVAGAEVSSSGVEGMLGTWNLTGTFLGFTVVTLLYTIDDLLLILEPLRLGYTDVAVGGLIGSLLFFVTANVGIIALVGTVELGPETLYFHFPVLLGFVALSAYFLWRERMTRANAALLLGLYLAYLVVTVHLFAVAPIGD